MLEYSSVCYKNSFLNQVIVRVDFAQFIQTNMVFDENIELIFLTHPKSNCRKNILLQKLLLLCM